MGFQDLKSRTIQRLDYGGKSSSSSKQFSTFTAARDKKFIKQKKEKAVEEDDSIDELPF